VGLRREEQLAGIIGYSGALAGPEDLEGEIKSRPPVLLLHGEEDDIVPPESLPEAVKALAGVGIEAKYSTRPGLGHGIDDECIIQAMEFLTNCFGVKLPDRKAK